MNRLLSCTSSRLCGAQCTANCHVGAWRHHAVDKIKRAARVALSLSLLLCSFISDIVGPAYPVVLLPQSVARGWASLVMSDIEWNVGILIYMKFMEYWKLFIIKLKPES